MSADNFLAVLKIGRRYIGYHCSASMDYPQDACYRCIGSKDFNVGTMEEAVDCCENFNSDGMGMLEYGYHFVNRAKPMRKRKLSLCAICPQNPSNPEEGSPEAKLLGCTCERILEEGFYSYMTRHNCPVHSNPTWQETCYKEQ